MISTLVVAARQMRTVSARFPRSMATKTATTKELAQVEEPLRETPDDRSEVQKYVEESREIDPTMVWGTTVARPPPDLPENISEIATLDPAHSNQDPPGLGTGEKRLVHITQEHARVTQSPLHGEQQWIISFQDEGELGQAWDNPLMGWVSSADPMGNMRLQMHFRNAADATYFAKKRGWDFIVDEPIVRKGRDDDAQYQDCFLPQMTTTKLRLEKMKCDMWSRTEAGTSHYFRPLKYHGKGLVPQHGPNGKQKIEPDVDGYFKIR